MSELDRVRGELRRRGYLSHGVERLLLQDALRPRRPLRALAALALKVGLFGGMGLAVAAAITLAALNGNLAVSPFDVVVMFVHLLLPSVALVAVCFLALGGSVALLLRLYPMRRIEPLSFTVAVLAGAATLVGALVEARRAGFVLEIPRWQLALLAVTVLAATWALIKVVHHGLLSLAIRLTEHAPGQRIFSRRGVGAVIAGGLLLLMLPVVMSARATQERGTIALPEGPGERVLLIGIDGVLPDEVEYLLAGSLRPGGGPARVGAAGAELPALAGLLADGAVLLSYPRQDEPPAARWTTIATGVDSALHGVAAVDSYRPLGVATPLSRLGPLRGYFDRVAVPLGLVEHRPLLAHRRRAYAWWELAARGGSPVVAVNWWSTFPAAPLPGLVVAHDGFQLLASGTTGAVQPEAELPALQRLAAGSDEAAAEAAGALMASLPAAAQADLLNRALAPDDFYRAAFRHGARSQPRAAALYLPALDLAAAGWRWSDVAFSDLLRAQLVATDRLLGEVAAGYGVVAVVFDPGRRAAEGQGRLLLWRRGGCAPVPGPVPGPVSRAGPAGPMTELSQLPSGLLRALGLPQSAELPAPPAACRWPAAASQVESYGQPAAPPQPAELGEEYLKGLKALGYL